MTHEEMTQKVIEFFEGNDNEFIRTIEDLDGYNGYLGDDRIFGMWEIDELFCDTKISDFLDMLGSHFDHNEEYFKSGVYGIESLAEKDYSDHLDKDFVDTLYDNRYRYVYIPDEIQEIFDEYDNQEESDE